MSKSKLLFISLGIVLTVWMYLMQQGGDFFKASVLDIKEAQIEFSGTTYPIKTVPNWLAWDGDNHTDFYSSIASTLLIPIPEYNPTNLTKSIESLTWGNNFDDMVRVAKITYSTVYLGNYELSGKEYAGSHPAVDIRVPTGTPVYAIANGIITKTSFQNSGFGNHIVIKHPRAPSLEDANKTVNIYSSYSHLHRIMVKEGDLVEKGQQIGEVGDTGASTTPHLHFQIDKDNTLWHPYWPFTSSEATAAGYSFFEAVNNGLNQSKAAENTINPMLYVQKYLDSAVQPVMQKPEVIVEPIKEPEVIVKPIKKPEVIVEPIKEEIIEQKVDYNLEITGETFAKVGTPAKIYIKAVDNYGQPLYNLEKLIKVSHNGQGKLNHDSLVLKKGEGELKYTSNTEETVTINIGDVSFELNIIVQAKEASEIRIESDGSFIPGVAETITLKLLSEDGKATPEYNFFNKVELSFSNGKGEFSNTKLSSRDFYNGQAEVTFTATTDTDRVRIKADNKIIHGESSTLSLDKNFVYNPFSDIPNNNSHLKAIVYLKRRGIISGYKDGTFKPRKTVNRAEALKILIEGLDIPINNDMIIKFDDVANNSWYVDYVRTAYLYNIATGYDDGKFQPNKTVNRAEFLKMVLETSGVNLKTVTQNPYDDVTPHDWYVSYADYTKNANLLDTKNNLLRADQPMTRAEVAEIIYRLKAIELAKADRYNEDIEI